LASKFILKSPYFNFVRGEGNWLGNLGIAYRNLGQIEKAIKYYQETLKIFEEIKSPNADVVRGWLEYLKISQ